MFESILNEHEVVRRVIPMAVLILHLPVVKSALFVRISVYIHTVFEALIKRC